MYITKHACTHQDACHQRDLDLACENPQLLSQIFQINCNIKFVELFFVYGNV